MKRSLYARGKSILLTSGGIGRAIAVGPSGNRVDARVNVGSFVVRWTGTFIGMHQKERERVTVRLMFCCVVPQSRYHSRVETFYTCIGLRVVFRCCFRSDV